jgi:hypothetical protein
MLSYVRTTVTLDPDVEQLVRRRMSAKGTGFKETLNDAVRAGLGATPTGGHRTPQRSLGRPQLNLDRALRLAGELEDEELLRKQRIGK